MLSSKALEVRAVLPSHPKSELDNPLLHVEASLGTVDKEAPRTTNRIYFLDLHKLSRRGSDL